MYVGEVAQLQAAMTFTSPHSMEVSVDVWAENVLSGERRHTNTAEREASPSTADPHTGRYIGHAIVYRVL